jgi:hypothetical protein
MPPGVPSAKQQAAVLDLAGGILSLSDEEMASLAQTIRQALDEGN